MAVVVFSCWVATRTLTNVPRLTQTMAWDQPLTTLEPEEIAER